MIVHYPLSVSSRHFSQFMTNFHSGFPFERPQPGSVSVLHSVLSAVVLHIFLLSQCERDQEMYNRKKYLYITLFPTLWKDKSSFLWKSLKDRGIWSNLLCWLCCTSIIPGDQISLISFPVPIPNKIQAVNTDIITYRYLMTTWLHP